MALTIRTTTEDEQLITELCNDLDIKTASGLLLHLLRTHKETVKTNFKLRHKTAKQSDYIYDSNRVIGRLHVAINDLNDFDIKDFK